jgi:hypothetical protein
MVKRERAVDRRTDNTMVKRKRAVDGRTDKIQWSKEKRL